MHKQTNRLVFLFACIYFISYLSRINFGTVISEMTTATGFSKSLLSMSLTGSFCTYGIGQIVSGIMGDRMSPKKLITCGMLITTVMNTLIPFCTSPYQMLPVWCINGFAQAFMWPPLVRIMIATLSAEEYDKAVVKVTWGSSFGTIVIYLVAPALISLFSWKAVFIFSASCALLMAFIWNHFACDVPPEPKMPKKTKAKTPRMRFFSPVIFGVMIAVILQGMLRDGVTTWMPSYIADTYNLSNAISILTGVLLPIFSIGCVSLTSIVYNKFFNNPVLCSALFFGCGTLFAGALALFTGTSAAASVVLSALLTGSMHSVNLILICIIPRFFLSTGNVSTVSGVLNSCTYIGSAISTYGIAVLSDNFGWSFTLKIWLLIAFLGMAMCLICAKPWQHLHGIHEETLDD